jgi:NAD+ synthase
VCHHPRVMGGGAVGGALARAARTETSSGAATVGTLPPPMKTNNDSKPFSKDVLAIDAPSVVETIGQSIKEIVMGRLGRRGVVVGLSGGIDSSVVAALCTRALGKERVFGIFMPERDSHGDSLRLGRLLADSLGIEAQVEAIGSALEGLGCYRRQDEAIRAVFPEYSEGYKSKITLPPILENDRLNVMQLTVQDPSGKLSTSRMPVGAFRQLVAATNFKQRVRKMVEYYHADRLGYAVAGTPNRLEYDQGFFVKQGDGAADFKPIAHLYKSQVYALAAFLGVPAEIRARPPTTDTYSLEQTQDEFFFALPYDRMDLCLYAKNHGVSAEEAAPVVGITPEQVLRVYKDIDAKRKAARYLHQAPLLIEPIAHGDRAGDAG